VMADVAPPRETGVTGDKVDSRWRGRLSSAPTVLQAKR
jgi:hypothetical protein